MGWRIPILGASIVLFALVQTSGAEPCQKDCQDRIGCEIEVTECLLNANRTREAIERLKPMVQKQPQNGAAARLLAKAYLEDDNPFWAERTLQMVIDDNPKDCETRSWLVWLFINQGDIDLAIDYLNEPGCPISNMDIVRWNLLWSTIARAQKDEDETATLFFELDKTSQLYPEDMPVWLKLRQQANPGWIEPLSFRFEILGGYTSNARAGSPADIQGQGPKSAIGRADLFGRLVFPTRRTIRPAMELNAKAHGLLKEETRDLSYLDLSVRPGVILGKSFPRWLLAYKGNLLLTGQDDKELFSEAHRGELELETEIGLLAFLGAGKRIFREGGRTRTEVDGGLGWSFSFLKRIDLLLALSGRYHWAFAAPYDLLGGTLLASVRVNILAGFYARVGITPSVDYYLNSGKERGALAFGTNEKRFEVSTKVIAEIWSPSLSGVRFGLRYAFSWRNSTADSVQGSYDYNEHRALLGVRYTFDMNPRLPEIVKLKDHVELDYGIEKSATSELDKDRIQDLLRQDEAMRAGSSCLD